MGQLILVRHCETASNAEGMVQGRRDLSLSKRGIDQARAVGTYLQENYSIDRVISSDRTRCLETAQSISESVTSTPFLREMDFGEWEGQKWSDIYTEYPDGIEALLTSDPNYSPPGGDTLASMGTRIDQAIDEFELRDSTDAVAIVSHDGTLRSMIARLMSWKPENMGNLTLFVGGITELSLNGSTTRIEMLNQYDHLSMSYEETN